MDLSELWPGARRGVIGIDVQPTSLRLVSLAGKSLAQASVAAMHVQPLPPGCVGDDRIEDIAAVAEPLRAALRAIGVRNKMAAMALPAAEVLRRSFRFERDLSPEELQYQVEVEVQSTMGLSLDDVHIDYAPMPGTQDANGEQFLVATASKPRVQDFQALAEAAGVKLVCLDAADLALDRVLCSALPADEPGLQVVVHVQHQQTEVLVWHEGEQIHSALLMNSEAQFLRQVADHGHGDAAKIQEAMVRQTWPSGAAERAIGAFSQQLTRAVDAELTRFYASSPFHRAARIHVAGLLANLPGLGEQLSMLCTKGCKVLNPFAGMALDAKLSKATLRQVASSSAVALGLAMRGLL